MSTRFECSRLLPSIGERTEVKTKPQASHKKGKKRKERSCSLHCECLWDVAHEAGTNWIGTWTWQELIGTKVLRGSRILTNRCRDGCEKLISQGRLRKQMEHSKITITTIEENMYTFFPRILWKSLYHIAYVWPFVFRKFSRPIAKHFRFVSR